MGVIKEIDVPTQTAMSRGSGETPMAAATLTAIGLSRIVAAVLLIIFVKKMPMDKMIATMKAGGNLPARRAKAEAMVWDKPLIRIASPNAKREPIIKMVGHSTAS
jgi:hypothetical protein